MKIKKKNASKIKIHVFCSINERENKNRFMTDYLALCMLTVQYQPHDIVPWSYNMFVRCWIWSRQKVTDEQIDILYLI